MERCLLISNTLLHLDHLGLAQLALAHGPQGAQPAQDGQTVAQEHGDPENGAGGAVAGLGHGGGVADHGHTAGGDQGREGGDDLVDQAVGAGDDGGDVLAAAVQLVVDDVRHEGRVGGGAGHHKAVADQREQNVEDHRDPEMCDCGGAAGKPYHSKESNDAEVGIDAVFRPVDNGFLVAVLATVTGAEDGKEDGGQHAADGEIGGDGHVANQDAGEHGAHNGGGAGLLGDLVRGGGDDVGLQGLVLAQHRPHILPVQAFLRLVGALEVFRLVIGGNTDAAEDHANEGNEHGKDGRGGQIGLAVVDGVAARFGHGDRAVLGQKLGVEDDGEGHGNQVVEYGVPHADRGTLLGIVGDQRADGLGRHVDDGITDDVEHIGGEEHAHAEAFAGCP